MLVILENPILKSQFSSLQVGMWRFRQSHGDFPFFVDDSALKIHNAQLPNRPSIYYLPQYPRSRTGGC